MVAQHQVDEGRIVSHHAGGHVGHRDRDPLGAGLGPKQVEHGRGQIDPPHHHPLPPGQGQGDPAGADGELDHRPATTGRSQVDQGVNRRGVKAIGVDGVVARGDDRIEVDVGPVSGFAQFGGPDPCHIITAVRPARPGQYSRSRST